MVMTSPKERHREEEEEEYYTPRELATLWKLDVSTVRKYIAHGRLPAWTVGEGPKTGYRIGKKAAQTYRANRMVPHSGDGGSGSE